MLMTLLDKIYRYRLQNDKEAAVNILMSSLSELQDQALEELEVEVDRAIDEIVPNADDLADRNPYFCKDCD